MDYEKYIEYEKRLVSLAAPIEHINRKDNKDEKDTGPFRNEFQRDRDRILYSKEFRRLSGKTQVFLTTSSDHIRNRLTHTLEVSQIARVTANKLKLRKDLSESISLGHDVGHTPFGHVGEKTLNFIMNDCDTLLDKNILPHHEKGFKHNLQSVRVVTELEKLYNRIGLNLTNFTLWGMKNHSSRFYSKTCDHFNKGDCFLNRNKKPCNFQGRLRVKYYAKYNPLLRKLNSYNASWSLEGYVVAVADEIAQRHHDVEDAIFMKIIDHEELNDEIESCFKNLFDGEDVDLMKDLRKNQSQNSSIYLPYVSKFIVNLLNKNLIRNSTKKIVEFTEDKSVNIKKPGDFISEYPKIIQKSVKDLISYDYEFAKREKRFHSFLKNRILNSFEVQRMDGKGRYIIKRLFKAYITNPRQLHDGTIQYVNLLWKQGNRDTLIDINNKNIGDLRNEIDSPQNKKDPVFMTALLRAICDHVAGMTDNFAISEHKRLYQ